MATATYSTIVGGDGTATITIQTMTQEIWTVAQVSIELPAGGPSGAIANLRKNTYLVTPLIASADVAAGEPYVRLLPTDRLTVEWENCTPGQQAVAQVFYEVAKR